MQGLDGAGDLPHQAGGFRAVEKLANGAPRDSSLQRHVEFWNQRERFGDLDATFAPGFQPRVPEGLEDPLGSGVCAPHSQLAKYDEWPARPGRSGLDEVIRDYRTTPWPLLHDSGGIELEMGSVFAFVCYRRRDPVACRTGLERHAQ
jgi:hypothetical protein